MGIHRAMRQVIAGCLLLLTAGGGLVVSGCEQEESQPAEVDERQSEFDEEVGRILEWPDEVPRDPPPRPPPPPPLCLDTTRLCLDAVARHLKEKKSLAGAPEGLHACLGRGDAKPSNEAACFTVSLGKDRRNDQEVVAHYYQGRVYVAYPLLSAKTCCEKGGIRPPKRSHFGYCLVPEMKDTVYEGEPEPCDGTPFCAPGDPMCAL